MPVLYGFSAPYSVIFYYKDGQIYKFCNSYGTTPTKWESFAEIQERLGKVYTFSVYSVKWAILRGVL